MKMDASPDKPKHNVKRIFALATLSAVCANFSITFPLSFLPDMVLSFGYSEEGKGVYTGLILACAFIGRTFAAYPNGWIADKIGRRPVLIYSTAIAGTMDFIFGFSSSLPMAMIVRLFSGLANSIQGTRYAMVHDVSDNSNQGLASVLISAGRGFGIFCAPLLSGYLAEPADKYPRVFSQHGLFGRFPFLLPSFLTTGLLWTTTIVNLILLDETKAPSIENKLSLQASWSKKVDHSRKELLKISGRSTGSQKGEKQPDTLLLPKEKSQGTSGCMGSLCRLLGQKDVILTTVIASLQGFCTIGLEGGVATWTSTKPRLGGLSYGTDQIGDVIGMATLPVFIVTPIIFPPLEKRLGAKKLTAYSIMLHLFVIPLLPNLRFLHESPIAQITILTLLMGLISLVAIMGISAITVLGINSVYKIDSGAANGLRASTSACAKGISATVGGIVYAWSISSGAKIGFPFDVNLFFIMYASVLLVTNILVAFTPNALNKQKV